jgi:hypothetical protein
MTMAKVLPAFARALGGGWYFGVYPGVLLPPRNFLICSLCARLAPDGMRADYSVSEPPGLRPVRSSCPVQTVSAVLLGGTLMTIGKKYPSRQGPRYCGVEHQKFLI